VHAAFQFPLRVRTLAANRVEIWGGRRSAGGTAQIESKAPGGSYRPVGSATVNDAGYFKRVFRVSGAARRTYRVTLDGVSRAKKP
jgi:hypothetical protein